MILSCVSSVILSLCVIGEFYSRAGCARTEKDCYHRVRGEIHLAFDDRRLIDARSDQGGREHRTGGEFRQ